MSPQNVSGCKHCGKFYENKRTQGEAPSFKSGKEDKMTK